MEELDLLKRAWRKDDHSFSQLSETEIYKMLHQQSSSIVKWILIISLIEFIFWNIITFAFSDDKYQAKLQAYGVDKVMFAINAVNYVIIIAFIPAP